MRTFAPIFFGIVSLLLTTGCGKTAKKSAAPKVVQSAVDTAPPIRVHADQKGYVYRYFPEGADKLKTASRIDKVPQASRKMVLVVPDNVDVPAGVVYVANLSKASGDGTFPYKVVASSDLDRTMEAARGETGGKKAATAGTGTQKTAVAASGKKSAVDNQIIMFSTTWCGVCGQARRWFDNKGIKITELDVEKDPKARAQMQALAKKAGFPAERLSGVPVIWVMGRMLAGFNPQTIERIIQSKS